MQRSGTVLREMRPFSALVRWQSAVCETAEKHSLPTRLCRPTRRQALLNVARTVDDAGKPGQEATDQRSDCRQHKYRRHRQLDAVRNSVRVHRCLAYRQ